MSIIKYDKSGKIIAFFCTRGRNKIIEPKQEKPLSEKEKLIKKLKELSKPKFIN